MSTPTLPCPKCGNKIWQGPRYVPPVKAITQWSEVLRPAEDDQLSYTCTDCRFVRYEEPLDRKQAVKEEAPRRTEKHELECPSTNHWGCERPVGHTGNHMAWEDYDSRELYSGGEWS